MDTILCCCCCLFAKKKQWDLSPWPAYLTLESGFWGHVCHLKILSSSHGGGLWWSRVVVVETEAAFCLRSIAHFSSAVLFIREAERSLLGWIGETVKMCALYSHFPWGTLTPQQRRPLCKLLAAKLPSAAPVFYSPASIIQPSCSSQCSLYFQVFTANLRGGECGGLPIKAVTPLPPCGLL